MVDALEDNIHVPYTSSQSHHTHNHAFPHPLSLSALSPTTYLFRRDLEEALWWEFFEVSFPVLLHKVVVQVAESGGIFARWAW